MRTIIVVLVLLSLLAHIFTDAHPTLPPTTRIVEAERRSKLKKLAKKLKKQHPLPPPPPPLYPMIQPLFMTLPFYVQQPKYQYVPVPIEVPSHVKGYYGAQTSGYVGGPMGQSYGHS